MTAPERPRGLVLAGGGIRVAWQTGVVTALSEAGLGFAHVDGTSGGIFTAAMMLSAASSRSSRRGDGAPWPDSTSPT